MLTIPQPQLSSVADTCRYLCSIVLMLANTEHSMQHFMSFLTSLETLSSTVYMELLTQGGKGPDSVGMVLSIEVSDLLASFSSQAVQEGISWVVHHLGKCPQRVGNVARAELVCVLHCSTTPVLVQPLNMLPIAMSKPGDKHSPQVARECFCRAACHSVLYCISLA